MGFAVSDSEIHISMCQKLQIKEAITYDLTEDGIWTSTSLAMKQYIAIFFYFKLVKRFFEVTKHGKTRHLSGRQTSRCRPDALGVSVVRSSSTTPQWRNGDVSGNRITPVETKLETVGTRIFLGKHLGHFGCFWAHKPWGNSFVWWNLSILCIKVSYTVSS